MMSSLMYDSICGLQVPASLEPHPRIAALLPRRAYHVIKIPSLRVVHPLLLMGW